MQIARPPEVTSASATANNRGVLALGTESFRAMVLRKPSERGESLRTAVGEDMLTSIGAAKPASDG